MTARIVVLVILLAITTSAATTAGIMLYQAGRFVDRLADVIAPQECLSDDDECFNQWFDGVRITKDEHKRVMDALFGRAI